MKKIDLSIIVLSWNTKELLRECLESVIGDQLSVTGEQLLVNSKKKLTADNQPLITEVIVVDNASIDGSVEMVKQEFPQVKLFVNRQNLGFARGNNQAIRCSQGKLVLFLNSDTIVQPGAVEILVEYLNKNIQIVAAGPLLLNEDGSIQKDPCYLKFPSPLLVLFYYNRALKLLAEKFFPKILYSSLNFQTPSEVDQLPGAALMIRKETFEKIGGFDEGFGHFFEDVDLSYRLQKEGNFLYLVPKAKIIHLGRKSLEPQVKKEGIESFYYLNFKSLFQFCQKHYSFWKVLSIKLITFLQLLAKLKINLIKKLFLK